MDDGSKNGDSPPTPGGQQDLEPRKCPMPHCGSSRVVRNGSYSTKRRGLVRRFICRACGHTWRGYGKPSDLFPEALFNDSDTSVLQAVALVAMGLPLSEVEGLMQRKAETIVERLKRCFERKEVWDRIVELLVTRHEITREEVKTLSSLLAKIKSGAASFHSPSRREAAARIRPHTRTDRKTQQASKEKFFEHAQEFCLERRLSWSKKKIEHLWGRQLRPPKPVPKRVKSAREILVARVQDVLSCQVAVTPTGHFYRLEDDPRVERWLQGVIDFDPNRGKKSLDLLDPLERMVFDQVRCPNQEAHLHAKLEGARGTLHGSPWEERMTLACMAEGLGVDAGEFIDRLKSAAEMLEP